MLSPSSGWISKPLGVGNAYSGKWERYRVNAYHSTARSPHFCLHFPLMCPFSSDLHSYLEDGGGVFLLNINACLLETTWPQRPENIYKKLMFEMIIYFAINVMYMA